MAKKTVAKSKAKAPAKAKAAPSAQAAQTKAALEMVKAKARGAAPAAAPEAAPLRPKIGFGEPTPFFIAPTDINPTFAYSTTAGRWMVLAFLGSMSAAPVKAAHDEAMARAELFNDDDACFFGVVIDPKEAPPSRQGYRYFHDPAMAISRQYNVADGERYRPTVFLVDRALRVVAVEPISNMSRVLDLLKEQVALEAPALMEMSAPVMTIPRIFEPALCETLIEYYRKDGGTRSGFMREVDGVTKLLHDDSHKRRSDVTIEDAELRNAIRARVERRLLPMIERSFQWKATQMERYLVARYADEEKGFFRAHRDNTTAGTAHRKFAVSINLNADYDGGLLRFPEFGRRTYKPPVGGATVFSCSLLHEATPVTRGERFVFVPFLYDDEGAAIRARNLHLVDLQSS